MKRNRFPTAAGTRFGRLVVIGQAPLLITKSGTARQYLCECDCGNRKIIHGGSLRSGRSNSCGCLHKEITSRREYKHGHTANKKWSQEYRAWKNMRYRCSSKKSSHYYRYGARGIKVCSRWNDFKLFIEDMGLKPSVKHSIERIDNDGNYEPSNCKWALESEQSRNKSTNRFLIFNGQKRILSDWSKILNLKPETIINRIKRGWTVENALSVPKLRSGSFWKRKGYKTND
jgi:hypothetical protein